MGENYTRAPPLFATTKLIYTCDIAYQPGTQSNITRWYQHVWRRKNNQIEIIGPLDISIFEIKMNPATDASSPGFSGQTISWSHELDTSKLTQGWFCRCGLQCTSKGKLNVHTNSFNRAHNFTCRLCSKLCPSVSFLHRHMEKCHQIMHRGWVGCGDCGTIFKTRLEQARHRAAIHDDYDRYCFKKSHTNDKKASSTCINAEHATVLATSTSSVFTCSCGKVFSSKEYLNRHQRYKLKMFKCPLCQKNFGQWYNLKNHLASKHVGEYQQECYECGKCGQVFSDIEHAVAHCQAVHGHHL